MRLAGASRFFFRTGRLFPDERPDERVFALVPAPPLEPRPRRGRLSMKPFSRALNMPPPSPSLGACASVINRRRLFRTAAACSRAACSASSSSTAQASPSGSRAPVTDSAATSYKRRQGQMGTKNGVQRCLGVRENCGASSQPLGKRHRRVRQVTTSAPGARWRAPRARSLASRARPSTSHGQSADRSLQTDPMREAGGACTFGWMHETGPPTRSGAPCPGRARPALASSPPALRAHLERCVDSRTACARRTAPARFCEPRLGPGPSG